MKLKSDIVETDVIVVKSDDECSDDDVVCISDSDTEVDSLIERPPISVENSQQCSVVQHSADVEIQSQQQQHLGELESTATPNNFDNQNVDSVISTLNTSLLSFGDITVPSLGSEECRDLFTDVEQDISLQNIWPDPTDLLNEEDDVLGDLNDCIPTLLEMDVSNIFSNLTFNLGSPSKLDEAADGCEELADVDMIADNSLLCLSDVINAGGFSDSAFMHDQPNESDDVDMVLSKTFVADICAVVANAPNEAFDFNCSDGGSSLEDVISLISNYSDAPKDLLLNDNSKLNEIEINRRIQNAGCTAMLEMSNGSVSDGCAENIFTVPNYDVQNKALPVIEQNVLQDNNATILTKAATDCRNDINSNVEICRDCTKRPFSEVDVETPCDALRCKRLRMDKTLNSSCSHENIDDAVQNLDSSNHSMISNTTNLHSLPTTVSNPEYVDTYTSKLNELVTKITKLCRETDFSFLTGRTAELSICPAATSRPQGIISTSNTLMNSPEQTYPMKDQSVEMAEVNSIDGKTSDEMNPLANKTSESYSFGNKALDITAELSVLNNLLRVTSEINNLITQASNSPHNFVVELPPKLNNFVPETEGCSSRTLELNNLIADVAEFYSLFLKSSTNGNVVASLSTNGNGIASSSANETGIASSSTNENGIASSSTNENGIASSSTNGIRIPSLSTNENGIASSSTNGNGFASSTYSDEQMNESTELTSLVTTVTCENEIEHSSFNRSSQLSLVLENSNSISVADSLNSHNFETEMFNLQGPVKEACDTNNLILDVVDSHISAKRATDSHCSWNEPSDSHNNNSLEEALESVVDSSNSCNESEPSDICKLMNESSNPHNSSDLPLADLSDSAINQNLFLAHDSSKEFTSLPVFVKETCDVLISRGESRNSVDVMDPCDLHYSTNELTDSQNSTNEADNSTNLDSSFSKLSNVGSVGEQHSPVNEASVAETSSDSPNFMFIAPEVPNFELSRARNELPNLNCSVTKESRQFLNAIPVVMETSGLEYSTSEPFHVPSFVNEPTELCSSLKNISSSCISSLETTYSPGMINVMQACERHVITEQFDLNSSINHDSSFINSDDSVEPTVNCSVSHELNFSDSNRVEPDVNSSINHDSSLNNSNNVESTANCSVNQESSFNSLLNQDSSLTNANRVEPSVNSSVDQDSSFNGSNRVMPTDGNNLVNLNNSNNVESTVNCSVNHKRSFNYGVDPADTSSSSHQETSLNKSSRFEPVVNISVNQDSSLNNTNNVESIANCSVNHERSFNYGVDPADTSSSSHQKTSLNKSSRFEPVVNISVNQDSSLNNSKNVESIANCSVNHERSFNYGVDPADTSSSSHQETSLNKSSRFEPIVNSSVNQDYSFNISIRVKPTDVKIVNQDSSLNDCNRVEPSVHSSVNQDSSFNISNRVEPTDINSSLDQDSSLNSSSTVNSDESCSVNDVAHTCCTAEYNMNRSVGDATSLKDPADDELMSCDDLPYDNNCSLNNEGNSCGSVVELNNMHCSVAGASSSLDLVATGLSHNMILHSWANNAGNSSVERDDLNNSVIDASRLQDSVKSGPFGLNSSFHDATSLNDSLEEMNKSVKKAVNSDDFEIKASYAANISINEENNLHASVMKREEIDSSANGSLCLPYCVETAETSKMNNSLKEYANSTTSVIEPNDLNSSNSTKTIVNLNKSIEVLPYISINSTKESVDSHVFRIKLCDMNSSLKKNRSDDILNDMNSSIDDTVSMHESVEAESEPCNKNSSVKDTSTDIFNDMNNSMNDSSSLLDSIVEPIEIDLGDMNRSTLDISVDMELNDTKSSLKDVTSLRDSVEVEPFEMKNPMYNEVNCVEVDAAVRLFEKNSSVDDADDLQDLQDENSSEHDATIFLNTSIENEPISDKRSVIQAVNLHESGIELYHMSSSVNDANLLNHSVEIVQSSDKMSNIQAVNLHKSRIEPYHLNSSVNDAAALNCSFEIEPSSDKMSVIEAINLHESRIEPHHLNSSVNDATVLNCSFEIEPSIEKMSVIEAVNLHEPEIEPHHLNSSVNDATLWNRSFEIEPSSDKMSVIEAINLHESRIEPHHLNSSVNDATVLNCSFEIEPSIEKMSVIEAVNLHEPEIEPHHLNSSVNDATLWNRSFEIEPSSDKMSVIEAINSHESRIEPHHLNSSVNDATVLNCSFEIEPSSDKMSVIEAINLHESRIEPHYLNSSVNDPTLLNRSVETEPSSDEMSVIETVNLHESRSEPCHLNSSVNDATLLNRSFEIQPSSDKMSVIETVNLHESKIEPYHLNSSVNDATILNRSVEIQPSNDKMSVIEAINLHESRIEPYYLNSSVNDATHLNHFVEIQPSSDKMSVIEAVNLHESRIEPFHLNSSVNDATLLNRSVEIQLFSDKMSVIEAVNLHESRIELHHFNSSVNNATLLNRSVEIVPSSDKMSVIEAVNFHESRIEPHHLNSSVNDATPLNRSVEIESSSDKMSVIEAINLHESRSDPYHLNSSVNDATHLNRSVEIVPSSDKMSVIEAVNLHESRIDPYHLNSSVNDATPLNRSVEIEPSNDKLSVFETVNLHESRSEPHHLNSSVNEDVGLNDSGVKHRVANFIANDVTTMLHDSVIVELCESSVNKTIHSHNSVVEPCVFNNTVNDSSSLQDSMEVVETCDMNESIYEIVDPHDPAIVSIASKSVHSPEVLPFKMNRSINVTINLPENVVKLCDEKRSVNDFATLSTLMEVEPCEMNSSRNSTTSLFDSDEYDIQSSVDDAVNVPESGVQTYNTNSAVDKVPTFVDGVVKKCDRNLTVHEVSRLSSSDYAVEIELSNKNWSVIKSVSLHDLELESCNVNKSLNETVAVHDESVVTEPYDLKSSIPEKLDVLQSPFGAVGSEDSTDLHCSEEITDSHNSINEPCDLQTLSNNSPTDLQNSLVCDPTEVHNSSIIEAELNISANEISVDESSVSNGSRNEIMESSNSINESVEIHSSAMDTSELERSDASGIQSSDHDTSGSNCDNAGSSLPNACQGDDPKTISIPDSDQPKDEFVSCFQCQNLIPKKSTAYCTSGHPCCGGCLHIQVKQLLMCKTKVAFGCQFFGCNSFYKISELHNSLPKMVVDILEEKLEREYSDSTAQLLKRFNGYEDSKDDIESEVDEGNKTTDGDSLDLPKFWLPMDNSKEFKLVEITFDSEEFEKVSSLFHQSMFSPRAKIVKLQRLQNPVLWRFYSFKKKQREIENNNISVLEKMLFHGIRKQFVETICQNNFDWRTCGVSHGIMYGQGTYFARDASYAHRFTDQQPRSSRSEDPIALVSSLKSCYGSNGRSVPSMTIDGNDDEILLETAHTNSGDWRRHVHLMFLARVLVGRYTRGKLSYRKPPPMDERKPFGRCFDSCVNYIDDPTLFVISDTSQYYPEYLIQYTNRPKQNGVSLSTKPH